MSSSHSPHGSKSWELTKYAANRMLSGPFRKKLKSLAHQLRTLPVRALGLDEIVRRQQAEIERLKSKLVLIDGKLKLALYGAPNLVDYRPVLLSETPLPLGDSFQNEEEDQTDVRATLSGSFFKDSQPEHALDLGEPVARLFHPALKSVEKTQGDPVSVLLSAREPRYDLITSVRIYERLSPREQSLLITLALERLKPGGALYLELPNLDSDEVAQDLYWRDSKVFRPYSLSAIRERARKLGVELEMEKLASGKTLGLLLRKPSVG